MLVFPPSSLLVKSWPTSAHALSMDLYLLLTFSRKYEPHSHNRELAIFFAADLFCPTSLVRYVSFKLLLFFLSHLCDAEPLSVRFEHVSRIARFVFAFPFFFACLPDPDMSSFLPEPEARCFPIPLFSSSVCGEIRPCRLSRHACPPPRFSRCDALAAPFTFSPPARALFPRRGFSWTDYRCDFGRP